MHLFHEDLLVRKHAKGLLSEWRFFFVFFSEKSFSASLSPIGKAILRPYCVPRTFKDIDEAEDPIHPLDGSSGVGGTGASHYGKTVGGRREGQPWWHSGSRQPGRLATSDWFLGHVS